MKLTSRSWVQRCGIQFEYHDSRKSEIIEQPFAGIMPSLEEKFRRTETAWVREELSRYKSKRDCGACNGYRLRGESLTVKVGGMHIGEVSKKTIASAHQWFAELESKLSPKHLKIAERVLKEIRSRLQFLMNVGF